MNSDLEKMYDKWNEKKPKDRHQLTFETAMEASEMMNELQEQWKTMQTRVAKVKRDCEHFGRQQPKLAFYDKMKDELEEQLDAWAVFGAFRQELDEIKKEEWLTYRKQKYFAFQDFFLA